MPAGTQAEAVDGSRVDLVEPGQRAVVAHGGRGGHGNKRFATSTRQAPRFAEKGTSGEEGWIEVRLKLLADAGLIGLPNAGKSSLLARLTRAAPKVGDYPFTTLSPVLGTIEDEDRQAVLADIPGLIEGAAEGAGLGHEFLAHVERCSMLVHLVDLAPLRATRWPTTRRCGRSCPPTAPAWSGCRSWSSSRSATCFQTSRWRRRWPSGGSGSATAATLDVLAVSSATGEGLDELRAARSSPRCPRRRPRGRSGGRGGPAEFEAEHRVYRPVGEGGYSVEREEDGGFRVLGRGVELLFERHDLNNEEALAYLEQRLNEIGVSRPCAPPASSRATTSASASTSSSCIHNRSARLPSFR